ncbi:MAG: DNA double-strand break repair nuclease NurA [Thermoplasmata archaeon]
MDGSYSFLWNSASLWLAVVKVGALLYRNGRIQGIEKHEKPVVISTREGFAAEDDLQATLFRLTRGAKEQHREIVNELRKYYEHQIALEAAQSGRNLILALDGSLASFPKETDRLGDVVRTCEERGHLLVGVSKDSATHAFGSSRTDEELLRPHEGMGFVPVPEEFEEHQRGLLHGDVYFARLHPQAPKWFRVDIGTGKEAPERALAEVAAYCASPLCVGYPRPLFEAHRFAVTIRQMREMYEDAIIKEGVRLGVPVPLLVDGLTSMEGAPHGTFHEYLDQVTRELK